MMIGGRSFVEHESLSRHIDSSPIYFLFEMKRYGFAFFIVQGFNDSIKSQSHIHYSVIKSSNWLGIDMCRQTLIDI